MLRCALSDETSVATILDKITKLNTTWSCVTREWKDSTHTAPSSQKPFSQKDFENPPARSSSFALHLLTDPFHNWKRLTTFTTSHLWRFSAFGHTGATLDPPALTPRLCDVRVNGQWQSRKACLSFHSHFSWTVCILVLETCNTLHILALQPWLPDAAIVYLVNN